MHTGMVLSAPNWLGPGLPASPAMASQQVCASLQPSGISIGLQGLPELMAQSSGPPSAPYTPFEGTVRDFCHQKLFIFIFIFVGIFPLSLFCLAKCKWVNVQCRIIYKACKRRWKCNKNVTAMLMKTRILNEGILSRVSWSKIICTFYFVGNAY